MKRMVLKTPAKINLALDVVGKRADGYHTLETVFQTVSLYDTITVTLFPHRTGEQAIRILCNIPWIPKDERNIAWKAVDLFLKKTGCPVDFDIYLQKYIPSQAGLGGGSSDAAAVLYACNQLTGAGLSHAELCEMGLQLGADVPFFFYGGTAYAAGVGEEIQPLPYLGDVSVVLAKGKGGISTAAAYAAMDALQNPPHPNVPEMKQRLQAYAEPKDLAPLCGNLFAEVTELLIVQKLQQEMLARGAFASLMTGSGSAGCFPRKNLLANAVRLCGRLFRLWHSARRFRILFMQYNFLNSKRTFPKRGFRECSFFCFQIENRKTKKIIEMANRIFHFVIYFLEKVWYDSIWFIRLHESTISCWITNHAAFHEIGSADSRIFIVIAAAKN